ncbi:hypothetical protein D0B32_10960 [Paraburkholderia sp. DHOC27]|nr:hypothetical protein D0B32_10960 [Paraburkholderia sp. DHOC27]
MYKTLYIDIPGTNSHTAHRQVIGALTHYGFRVTRVSTKQSRNVAQVKVLARHCADDHEQAAKLIARVLPMGTRVGVGVGNLFQ